MKRRYLHFAVLALGLILAVSGCGTKYKLNRILIDSSPKWDALGGSPARLGRTEDGGFSGRLSIRWMRSTGGKPSGPLAIYHGALVYPESKKRLKYYDLASGRLLGQYKSKGIPQTGLTVTDTLGFYGVSPRKNFVRALNLLRAKRLWQVEIKDVHPGPIIVNDRLIVSSATGRISALNLMTGDPVWNYRAERRLSAAASYADGRIFQPLDRGGLMVLSADDGHELYRVELDGPLVSPVVLADRVYACDMLGHVYALEPSDGSQMWQAQLDGPIWSTPALGKDRLFVSLSSGAVVGLEAVSGDVIWRHETGSVVEASPLVIGDLVVAGTLGGQVLVLSATDGRVIDSAEVKGAIDVAPVTDGRRVYVATQDGKIICFGELDEQANDLAHNRVPPQHKPE